MYVPVWGQDRPVKEDTNSSWARTKKKTMCSENQCFVTKLLNFIFTKHSTKWFDHSLKYFPNLKKLLNPLSLPHTWSLKLKEVFSFNTYLEDWAGLFIECYCKNCWWVLLLKKLKVGGGEWRKLNQIHFQTLF